MVSSQNTAKESSNALKRKREDDDDDDDAYDNLSWDTFPWCLLFSNNSPLDG